MYLGFCPLCKKGSMKILGQSGDVVGIACDSCGKFRMIDTDLMHYQGAEGDFHLVSGYLRNRMYEGETLFLVTREHLENPEVSLGVARKTVSERMLATLDLVAQRTQEFGASVAIDYPTAWPQVWCTGYREFRNILEHLIDSGHLIKISGKENAFEVKLSAGGWRMLEEDSRNNPVLNKRIFVAMSFAQDLEEIYEKGIRPSIGAAGFEAIRVDRVEHNEKICDKILADIRSCGLVVADFTGQREGVYFEAGFAAGLGKPVIWTCRSDWFKRTHFDTNHYNHIVWKDIDELKTRLVNRILATVASPST